MRPRVIPKDPLNVLAVEPWFAGSHKEFLTGLEKNSRHLLHPLTLPGRYWKWRQAGSGLILGQKALDNPPPCDVIFASDFLNLPDFLALTRGVYPDVPAILYFHENQITYPQAEGGKLDLAYQQANLSGAAAADIVAFNSEYHRDAFFDGLDSLIAMSPDFAPKHLAGQIRAKACVASLGVDLAGLDAYRQEKEPDAPLTIVWNHRWEHDKNPEEFFAALFALSARRIDFRLVVLGQRFSRTPEIFAEARERLKKHIFHWGFAESRAEYARLVSGSDVVVSLAHHDFFGVSVVEAMHLGCMPLLANRLNYPFLVPKTAHNDCLLEADDQLEARLAALCKNPRAARDKPTRTWAAPHDWAQAVFHFDALFERGAETPRATTP